MYVIFIWSYSLIIFSIHLLYYLYCHRLLLLIQSVYIFEAKYNKPFRERGHTYFHAPLSAIMQHRMALDIVTHILPTQFLTKCDWKLNCQTDGILYTFNNSCRELHKWHEAVNGQQSGDQCLDVAPVILFFRQSAQQLSISVSSSMKVIHGKHWFYLEMTCLYFQYMVYSLEQKMLLPEPWYTAKNSVFVPTSSCCMYSWLCFFFFMEKTSGDFIFLSHWHHQTTKLSNYIVFARLRGKRTGWRKKIWASAEGTPPQVEHKIFHIMINRPHISQLCQF